MARGSGSLAHMAVLHKTVHVSLDPPPEVGALQKLQGLGSARVASRYRLVVRSQQPQAERIVLQHIQSIPKAQAAPIPGALRKRYPAAVPYAAIQHPQHLIREQITKDHPEDRTVMVQREGHSSEPCALHTPTSS